MTLDQNFPRKSFLLIGKHHFLESGGDQKKDPFLERDHLTWVKIRVMNIRVDFGSFAGSKKTFPTLVMKVSKSIKGMMSRGCQQNLA